MKKGVMGYVQKKQSNDRIEKWNSALINTDEMSGLRP